MKNWKAHLKIHLKMMKKSVEIVGKGIAAGLAVLTITICLIFASAVLGQWRVNVNVERMEAVEKIVGF